MAHTGVRGRAPHIVTVKSLRDVEDFLRVHEQELHADARELQHRLDGMQAELRQFRAKFKGTDHIGGVREGHGHRFDQLGSFTHDHADAAGGGTVSHGDLTGKDTFSEHNAAYVDHSGTSVTMSSNSFALTAGIAFYTVSPEGGSPGTDQLDTITGGTNGQQIELVFNKLDTITITANAGGGDDFVQLPGGGSSYIVGSSGITGIQLVKTSLGWYPISTSGLYGHDHLDAAGGGVLAYLKQDGSLPLTANWNPGVFDIGNYDFTARPLDAYIGDANFLLELVGTGPKLVGDHAGGTEDFLEFTRSTNIWGFYVGNTLVAAITANGLTVSDPGYISLEASGGNEDFRLDYDGGANPILFFDYTDKDYFGYDHSDDEFSFVIGNSEVLRFGDGEFLTGSKASAEFGFTIEDPTASEDIAIIRFDQAVTITELNATVVGPTSPSCTINPKHSTDRSANDASDNHLLSSATAITNTTTGQSITAFNDATIPANSVLWLETTAISATAPTELHISIKFTRDSV